MVIGLDLFKEHFEKYSDNYVLIGGSAADIFLEEVGLEFRVTKDLDIVLCVEALNREFVQAFWNFIKLGKYSQCQISTGKRLFYRFYNPEISAFPKMLELFSRVPDALDLKEGSKLTPIPVDDSVSSLSAILLDDDYYRFIIGNRILVNGISLVNAEAIIPLKSYAFLNLIEERKIDTRVQSQHIKKHKNDILRLVALLDFREQIEVSNRIRLDLIKTLELLETQPVDLKSIGISSKEVNFSDILAKMRRFYGLN